MKLLRDWLTQGRPALGAALLLLACASIAMLLYEGSRAPAAAGLPSFRGADKVLHFGAHFWVSALMFWGLALQRIGTHIRRRVVGSAGIVLAVDILAGIAVETIQLTLGSAHGRTFDGLDVAANSLGTACALLVSLCVALQLLKGRE